MTEIQTLMDSRGNNFLSSASHPAPAAVSIQQGYTIPVVVGRKGYTTNHGVYHEFQTVGG